MELYEDIKLNYLILCIHIEHMTVSNIYIH